MTANSQCPNTIPDEVFASVERMERARSGGHDLPQDGTINFDHPSFGTGVFGIPTPRPPLDQPIENKPDVVGVAFLVCGLTVIFYGVIALLVWLILRG